MTLAEFKETSGDFKILSSVVSGISMIVLVNKVAEAAYQAGLEQGITRRIMAGKK